MIIKLIFIDKNKKVLAKHNDILYRYLLLWSFVIVLFGFGTSEGRWNRQCCYKLNAISILFQTDDNRNVD